jgi:hypothetical protein
MKKTKSINRAQNKEYAGKLGGKRVKTFAEMFPK